MTIQWTQNTKAVEESGQLAAILLFEKQWSQSASLRRLNGVFGDKLSSLLEAQKFEAKLGDCRLFPSYGKTKAAYVLIVGGGPLKKASCETLRHFAGIATREANRLKLKSLSLEIPTGLKESVTDLTQAAVEAVVLRYYQFNRYKSEKQAQTLQAVSLCFSKSLPPAAFQKARLTGEMKAVGANFTRDLVNTVPKDMTPTQLGREAQALAKLPGISVRIYEKKEIEKMKMGGLLAVSQGSDEPPVFIHLKYKGKKKKSIALVGKGITFDSGGLNLKVGTSHIEKMKYDMGGAAAVLGVFRALSALKPAVSVEGFIAAAENMPSGKAQHPGNVITMMNGKTVEVLNTDAEGRLVLGDALEFAVKQKPDQMIDMATLTGACVVALGTRYAGLMGSDSKMNQKLCQVGERVGDNLWELPLPEVYRKQIDSLIADLQNIGDGSGGGTLTAGLFLKEFTQDHPHWVHLDIAGVAWTDNELEYLCKGATGAPVRALLQYILEA